MELTHSQTYVVICFQISIFEPLETTPVFEMLYSDLL